MSEKDDPSGVEGLKAAAKLVKNMPRLENVNARVELPERPTKCTLCGGELVSGAFGQTACRVCQPHKFMACVKCGAPRLECTC